MCGICGFVNSSNCQDDDSLLKMVSVLKHRGPDDYGTYIDQTDIAKVGLGQTRLSVIDLSVMGHQPMKFEHFTIVFNGEIYNYLEIRTELLALQHTFNSNSDTEVILHAHAQWGRYAVKKFIGMFSYVLYDSQELTITMYRDRAGVKPLYYYTSKDLILFSSELKSFHQHPDFVKEIDNGALTLFFKLGFIPAPYSIFKNVYKLEAGHFLKYNIASQKISITQYWNVLNYYSKPVLNIDYKDAKIALEKLLVSACEYRMIADVPVGIFLSGGYDSTVVTALLQKDRTDKLKTFTIGFEYGNNEAPFAKKIAHHLNTDHTELYCTANDAKKIIPLLPYYFDEPFADNSAIPTILISQLAKKQVTVALSADGGDEVFAGYSHYETFSKHMRQIDTIPFLLKRPTKKIATSLLRFFPERYVYYQHRLNGFANTINLNGNSQVNTLYEQMSYFPSYYINKLLLKPKNDYETAFGKNYSQFRETASIPLAIDYLNFLQDDILTKVDRATMSVALEGREPLLDHRLIEFAAQLPHAYKNDGITAKRILKDIVHQYVPKELLFKSKAGFDPPVSRWLRADCWELLDYYLSEDVVKKSGLLDEKFVTKIKYLFLADKLHYSQQVWRILQFQMWYELWMM